MEKLGVDEERTRGNPITGRRRSQTSAGGTGFAGIGRAQEIKVASFQYEVAASEDPSLGSSN